MSLKGDGFMIMWHDVRAEADADYHLWHTREHMPERLGVPGFLRGRRGVDRRRDRHRYLILYEGESVATFAAPPYLDRLNDPTPWSRRVQPSFTNFIRSACDVAASVGRGVGGAMATMRVKFAAGGERELRAIAPALAGELLALDGTTAVHIATARPDVSGIETRETALRGAANDAVFDAVILVDGISRREIEAIMPAITRLVTARGITIDPGEAATYDLAFCLEPTR
jgi:hypothetical protein